MTLKRFRVSDCSDVRPAERCLRRGVETLSDAELVACLVGPSRRHPDPLSLATTLLGDGLPSLATQDFTAARVVDDVGLRTAARLAATLELTRRLTAPPLTDRPLLTAPSAVARYLQARAAAWPEERVGALCLDTRHRLIADRELVRGSLESAAITPRDVLRRCLLDAASAFVLYHNHPSGDPTPSQDDLDFTRVLFTAARPLGVRFLDHLVVGREGVVSLAERGLLST